MAHHFQFTFTLHSWLITLNLWRECWRYNLAMTQMWNDFDINLVVLKTIFIHLMQRNLIILYLAYTVDFTASISEKYRLNEENPEKMRLIEENSKIKSALFVKNIMKIAKNNGNFWQIEKNAFLKLHGLQFCYWMKFAIFHRWKFPHIHCLKTIKTCLLRQWCAINGASSSIS